MHTGEFTNLIYDQGVSSHLDIGSVKSCVNVLVQILDRLKASDN